MSLAQTWSLHATSKKCKLARYFLNLNMITGSYLEIDTNLIDEQSINYLSE